jgi:hypothetical protein
VNTPDIMPTLLGICDIPIPEGVQGTDYSKSALDADAAAPSSAFISMAVPLTTVRSFGIAEYRGVRTQRYTYVRSIHGPWLLYDNQEDPYQMNNLCDKPAARDVQRQLDRELDAWLKTLDDSFLPADDYLKRDGWAHFQETKVPIRHIKSPWGDWQSTLGMASRGLSSRSAISDLLENPAAREILEETLPGVAVNPVFEGSTGWLSLQTMKTLMRGQMTDAQLEVLDQRLAKLPMAVSDARQ